MIPRDELIRMAMDAECIDLNADHLECFAYAVIDWFKANGMEVAGYKDYRGRFFYKEDPIVQGEIYPTTVYEVKEQS